MNKKLWLAIFMVFSSLTIRAQVCSSDTIFSDVVFVIDNSGSIDSSEYIAFANIIQATVNKVQASCPQAQVGVVHYGGNFGQETSIEYPLSSTNVINTIERQFCDSLNQFGLCAGGGGDDLNFAMGQLVSYFNSGMLNHDTANNLSIVIFTDAFDGATTCTQPNCSILRPFTNIDILKSQFDARVTVVGASMQANAAILQVYASPGGSYDNVPLDADCSTSFDGCVQPRKYVPIEFNSDVNSTSDSISACVACDMIIIPQIMVDAGPDVTVCEDLAESTTLMATATGSGTITFNWDNGLGAGANHVVTPTTTTTYTVTASNQFGCSATDQVTVTAATCGPDCDPDTTFTDVIFLIDNSGSIDDSEFIAFENIILSSLDGIRTSCPVSRRAVVHYGGANGTSTTVEYALGQVNQITDINRQFCTARNGSGICIGGGGDDLNNAIGDIMTFLNDGTLNRDPSNHLSLVIMTDAFGFDTTCGQPNCSLILPTTNIDMMKANYGVDVSVVGISSQAEESVLGIYASPGGSFNSPLYAPACGTSFDGCSLPRKYVQVEFNTPPGDVANMITSFVECTIDIEPPVTVDAGPDVTICSNFGEMAALTAQGSMGVPPYMYSWSNGLGTMQSVTVAPVVSTTYYVTVTDANTCTNIDSVTVNPQLCNDCQADAGTPLPPNEICLENGSANLPTASNIGLVIPMGFEEVFILTNDDLVILDYSIGSSTFNVNEAGLYRIHTLIAEVSNPASDDYIDLGIITRGSSELFIIVNCVNNHEVCADFDYPGRVHLVLGPEDMMCMQFENSINLCHDGIDNDGDGLIDCADEDCSGLVNCLENTLIACNDLTDNDNDGLLDCDDPDCFGFTLCFERGADCADGIDNDGDGLVDCADSSCAGSNLCEEDSPFTCVDGKDNDLDGLIDCQEASCQIFTVCAEYSVDACSDGIDNDFDGLIDCADANCMDLLGDDCFPSEDTPEKCSDGMDNDNDGLVDCADPDCITPELLMVEGNMNLVVEVDNATCPDNDNGVIRFVGIAQNANFRYSIDGGDSFSSSFTFTGLSVGSYTVVIESAMGCALTSQVMITGQSCVEICHNGVDDDFDGLVDCNDPDCTNGSDPYNPQITNITAASCPTFNSGSFSIANMPFNVVYSINGINYQSLPQFSGLTPGDYTLTYKDVNGCYGGITVTIPELANDADSDGVCDEDDVCPNLNDNLIGQACDDGDPCTENDTYQSNCQCTGTYTDDDNDGICNAEDQCEGFDDALIGTACDDGNSCTINDTYTANCQCLGLFTDSDGDGVCDSEDQCPGVDDDNCREICNNGLDDDGDGLIDCADVEDCEFNGFGLLDIKLTPDTGQDASVMNTESTQDQNFGQSTSLLVAEGAANPDGTDPYHSHSYVDFPIGQIFNLPNIVIDSAVMTLYADPNQMSSNVGNNSTLVHLLADSWKEDSVTWNTSPNYNPDYFEVIPRNNDFISVTVDVKDLLDKIVEEGLPWHGFILQPREKTPTRSIVFASSENQDQTRTPELYIEYHADCPPPINAAATIDLELTVMLQGAYIEDEQLMSTALNEGGYLPGQTPGTFFGKATPAGQPFNQAPWFYEGDEGKSMKSKNKSNVGIYDEDIVDWALVSLRANPSRPSEVWRGAALLHDNGQVELFNSITLDEVNPEGYYLVIEHRNHLPVMSPFKVNIVDGVITYDFTRGDSFKSILGIGQIESEDGVFMMVAGNGELIVELSSDIDINVRDLTIWLQNNGANSSYFLEDYDMNGDINIKDRILWEKNNGLFTTLQTK